MELKLDFYEDEYRKIAESFSQTFLEDENKKTKNRNLNLILFFVLAAIWIPPLKYDTVFIYPCIISLISAGLYFRKTKKLAAKAIGLIEENNLESEKYIAKMRGMEGIKYVYDNDKLEYYEEGKLVDTFKWSNMYLLGKEGQGKLITVHFHLPDTYIIIPQSMANPDEYQVFEETAKRKLEELGFEMTE